MIRNFLTAILILSAGLLTYVAIVGSFVAPGPGEPQAGNPSLASTLALIATILLAVSIFLFFTKKKYWWVTIAINLILSVAAIVCLAPTPGP